MNSGSETIRERRSDVINLTLVELMIVAIFITSAYSFLAKEEDRVNISQNEKELIEAKKDLEKANEYSRKLELDNANKRIELVRLSNEVKQLQDRLERTIVLAEQVNPEIRTEIRKVPVAAKKGEGGTGHPKCPESTGYLLDIKINNDGTLDTSGSWREGEYPLLQSIPGLKLLAQTEGITPAVFSRSAKKIFKWSDTRRPRCRFHVKTKLVDRENTTAGLYQRQIKVIERYFYAKK